MWVFMDFFWGGGDYNGFKKKIKRDRIKKNCIFAGRKKRRINMKKTVFIALAMLFAMSAKAQTFSASYDNEPLGPTDTLSLKAEEEDFEFKPHFQNNSSHNIIARIEIETLNETTTRVMSTCTGLLCMSGPASAPFQILANSNYTDTHIDFMVPEDAPMGLFRVHIYDTVNPNNETQFFLKLYNKNATVGISDVAEEASFVAYPNPTSGSVNIDYSLRNEEGEVRVYNMTGACVRSVELSGSEGCVRMDLTGLPAGVYMYGLCDGQRTSGMKKLVVK